MSNFRSQLDRIARPQPETGGARTAGRKAIDAVQRDLDRAWQAPARAPLRHDAIQRAPEIDRLQAEVHAVRAELAAAIDRAAVAREPHYNPGPAAEAARHAADPGRRERAAMAEELARMREQGGATAKVLEQIAGEMIGLRTLVESLARQPAPRGIDDSALNQSIAAGYRELAGRMEQTMAHLAERQARQPAPAAELGMLSEHVTAIRDAIDALPVRFPIAAVHQQLDTLAHAIERMTGQDGGSLAGHFGDLNERLDEVTRALVTLSVGGSGDSLERIEARLATLAKTVEQFAMEAQADRSPADLQDSFADEIRASLAAIGERLAARDQAVTGAPELLASIEAQMRQLSLKLDNIPAMQTAAGDLSASDGALARLEAIAERLGRAGPAQQAHDPAFHAAIEHQLDELNRRLDAVASAVAARPQSPMPDELSALLEEIAGRLEGVENAHRPVSPDSDELARLNERLERLTANLDAGGQGAVDFAPLAQRLDSIEQQVALSRDIAIDVAAQAAERAVALAAAANPAAGDRQHASLAADLAELQSATEALANRGDAIDALGGTLADISARLGELESRLADASADVRAPAPPPAHHDGESFDRSAGDAGLRNVADTPPLAQEHFEAEPGPADLAAVAAAGDDANGQPDTSLDPELEDVPLEPGTGAPDLATLVRRASERRQGSRSDAPAVSASDVIAAARRAAQAAARESASAQPPKPERKPAAVAPNRLSTLAGLLAGKRNLLAGVALAALVVVAGSYIAGRLLRGGEEVAQAPGAEQQSANQLAAGTGQAEQKQSVETRDPARQEDKPAEKSQADAAAPRIETQAAALEEAAPKEADPQPAAQLESGGARNAAKSLAGKEITKAPTPPEEAGNVLIREAAASGNPAALFEIGRRYTDGDIVERDLAKAAEWYRLAAEAGYAPAQYRLGNFHEKGHGVGIDLAEAAVWYRKAAEQGNALAMHNLAVLQTSGLVGGKPDMAEAIDWFTKASELGVKDSQVNLGILFTRGMGVKENLVEAYKWFAVAARGGDADAATKRDTLANAMRPDQLTQARGLAELWKPAALDAAANQATADPQWMAAPGKSAATTQDDMIARAQALLAKLGFDPGPADGKMGTKTRDAVKAFQRRAGIKIDGEIDADLIAALLKGNA